MPAPIARPSSDGPLSIPHRGDTLNHRENTLEAIDSAMVSGADAVEIDVQLAADGTVVVLHDDTLERLWGDPRPVAMMTWPEIAALPGPERLPRLDEALELSDHHGIPLVLDQKHPVAGLAAARLVTRSEASSTAFCGSLEGLLSIRAMLPGATVYLNDASPDLPDVRILAAVRPQYYNPHWRFLSPATIDAMRSFGIKTCCWTPNDPDALALVVAMGVDAVMTDRPDLLRELVEARPS